MKFYCKTALLIDDNDIDNVLNQAIIRRGKFAEKIIIKKTAENAIFFLKNEAIQKNQVPDIIFLDIRMPVNDGFYFLEMYKDLPVEIITKAKLVMLTSSLAHRDLKRAADNKYVKLMLDKPLTIEVLEDLKKLF